MDFLRLQLLYGILYASHIALLHSMWVSMCEPNTLLPFRWLFMLDFNHWFMCKTNEKPNWYTFTLHWLNGMTINIHIECLDRAHANRLNTGGYMNSNGMHDIKWKWIRSYITEYRVGLVSWRLLSVLLLLLICIQKKKEKQQRDCRCLALEANFHIVALQRYHYRMVLAMRTI